MISQDVVVAARFLAHLADLPLECDGTTRALSHLLNHAHVEHEVHVGALEVDGVGRIDHHWWIKLRDGFVCDARTVMWLGPEACVQQGVFNPSPLMSYKTEAILFPECNATIFWILTGQSSQSFLTHFNNHGHTSI